MPNKGGIANNCLKDISDLDKEMEYKDFKRYKDFQPVCKLKPDKKSESLKIYDGVEDLVNRKGIVYVLVVNGKIFKIGQSINSIKKRIQSYNCGKKKYRKDRGTNSTTNYFVLQSLLNIGYDVEVYGFFPEQPKFKIFGKEYQESRSPSKVAENIIIKELIRDNNGNKPIGNKQK